MPRTRPASRLLLISPANGLLLFKIHYDIGALAGESYWATPGGALRDEESFEAAAVRELHEETGVEVLSVGPCIARREFPWQMPEGERVLAIEQYYVVHAATEHWSSSDWSARERDAVCDVRWWSLSDLLACRDKIYPRDLPALFDEALHHRLVGSTGIA